MGAGFGKCLGQGKDKNGEQQHYCLGFDINEQDEHLENFFERNARQTFTEADWDSITDEQLAVIPPTLNVYAKEETHSVVAVNISELFSQVHEEFKTEKQELALQNKDGV